MKRNFPYREQFQLYSEKISAISAVILPTGSFFSPIRNNTQPVIVKLANPVFAHEELCAVRVNICHGDETQENRRAQPRVFSVLGAHRNVWHI